ncbi:MAG: putative anti-sigma regulatory factor, serine/threonine protein kinase [Frankiales bacterium]|nr:putative anti-sigma regulatory factor, serine/threonine protein kinase [Frankiales bacterium]
MCETTVRAELLLPTSTTSPRAARAFARESECAEHATCLLDEALLLVSELVTNAVRHGAPPILVAMECDGSGLRIHVRDGDVALPQQRQALADDEGGRGLALLEALSDAWGVEPVADEHGVGKAVWFELRMPDQGPRARAFAGPV